MRSKVVRHRLRFVSVMSSSVKIFLRTSFLMKETHTAILPSCKTYTDNCNCCVIHQFFTQQKDFHDCTRQRAHACACVCVCLWVKYAYMCASVCLSVSLPVSVCMHACVECSFCISCCKVIFFSLSAFSSLFFFFLPRGIIPKEKSPQISSEVIQKILALLQIMPLRRRTAFTLQKEVF